MIECKFKHNKTKQTNKDPQFIQNHNNGRRHLEVDAQQTCEWIKFLLNLRATALDYGKSSRKSKKPPFYTSPSLKTIQCNIHISPSTVPYTSTIM